MKKKVYRLLIPTALVFRPRYFLVSTKPLAKVDSDLHFVDCRDKLIADQQQQQLQVEGEYILSKAGTTFTNRTKQGDTLPFFCLDREKKNKKFIIINRQSGFFLPNHE